MAKATRKKKTDTIPETPAVEPQPQVPPPTEPAPEVVEEQTTPEPEVEVKPEPEVVVDPAPEPTPEVVEPPKQEVAPPPPAPTLAPQADLSMEENITRFLSTRSNGDFVKLNDFLKSLFPIPRFNAPPEWATQPASKQLRVLLEKMTAEGKIVIKNDFHKKLGVPYYPTDDGRTHYYNLNTVPLEGRL